VLASLLRAREMDGAYAAAIANISLAAQDLMLGGRDEADQWLLQEQIERFAAQQLAPDGRDLLEANGKVIVAGARVEIFGLQRTPELNNTFGRVVAYKADPGRCAVELEQQVWDALIGTHAFMWSEKIVLIKPKKLRLAPRMPAAVGRAAGSRLDIKYVLSWLDAGGDIEARHPSDNDTLLTLASSHGAHVLVVELLRRKADVEAVARHNTTALMIAATGVGGVSMPTVQALLNAKANVGKKDEFAQDALYKAQSEGHFNVVKLLREHGAEITMHPPVNISKGEKCPDISGGSAIYWTEGVCAGCSGEATLRPGFQCCPRCVQDKLTTPAQFCSKTCFAQHWPAHKRWHATRDENAPKDGSKSPEADAVRERRAKHDKELHETARFLESKGDYAQLIAQATDAFMAGDLLQSKKLCQRAIAIDPGWWTAHQLLGDCLSAGGDYVAALAANLRAAEATGPGSDAHRANPTGAPVKNAVACAKAYEAVMLLTDDQLPSDLPEWMTGRKLLLEKAEIVVAAVPELDSAHTMRANALVNMPSRPMHRCDDILAGEITPAHFREAAKSWQRAAEVTNHEASQAIFASNAVVCSGQAASIEAGLEWNSRAAAGMARYDPSSWS
jgi:tetratricopeptide (TPR) repeat protein